MKFGICTNMNSTAKDGIGAEHIAFFAQCGFDYVELPLAQVMALDNAAFSFLLAELESANIPCLACNNLYPSNVRLTGESFNLSVAVDYSRRALERAAKLGAKSVVLGSSGARNVPFGFDLTTAEKQFISVLTAIAPIASDHGVVIAVEQHSPVEGNIFNRFEEVIAVVKATGHSSIRCLYDNFHSEVVLEPMDIFEEFVDLIQHVHVSGVMRNREYPKDEAHFRKLMSMLRTHGYNGTVSIESNAKDLYSEAPQALEMLRRVSI